MEGSYKFGSWEEAYKFQVDSINDQYDSYFMELYMPSTGIEEIDNVTVTNPYDRVVWMIETKEDQHYMQYGVNEEGKWTSLIYTYDLVSDEYLLSDVANYSSVDELIEKNESAIAICKYIAELFSIYQFLGNGKFKKADSINQNYVDNIPYVILHAVDILKAKEREETKMTETIGKNEPVEKMEESKKVEVQMNDYILRFSTEVNYSNNLEEFKFKAESDQKAVEFLKTYTKAGFPYLELYKPLQTIITYNNI